MTQLLEHLESSGLTVTPLSRQDAHKWFQCWRQTFCAKVYQASGSFCHNGLHWHAFSYELVPALEGHQAVQEYEALDNQDIVIVEESRQGPGFKCSGARLPDLAALQLDAYVFPETLEWTMAFTHETGVHGPFFTRLDWCRVDD